MGVCLSAPGLVSCAGNNREALFDTALRGDQSGIGQMSLADGRRFPAGIVAEGVLSAAGALTPGTGGKLYRMTALALEQIRPDVEAALAAYGPDRIGVCAGSCDNGSELSLSAHRAFFAEGEFPAAYDIHFQSASLVAEYIAARFGISGPCLTVATACASGAGAIVKGAELIESGICGAVIAGGADLVSETALSGFAALEAVSAAVCNPFSKNRGGITLGEGAAFFVMRKDDGDRAAAGPRVELLGRGESADAHHMTAPRSDGAGALSAMGEALASAGIGPGGVDYINLHGTGTPLNDQMEAAAIRAVFADNAPPVSSTKPVTGHTLGAAGALELALCWMILARRPENGKLPVHCWDGERDSALPFLNFAGRETLAAPRICMSNSFAFGGCNVSLIIGRRD